MYYNADWKKYFIVFLITAGVFGTAFYISDRLGRERMQQLQSIQEQISMDILSSETQFDLLSEASCEVIGDSALSKELDTLGGKLSFLEDQQTYNEEELEWLKRNYALLEIKDYLLMKKLADRCDTEPVFVLYFYSNEKGECDMDCKRQGMVLTRLREDYPGLRVYSFDYNMDVSAVQTLIELHKVEKALPALIIHDKAYYGYRTIEEIEELMPELEELKKLAEEKKALEAAEEGVDGTDAQADGGEQNGE